MNWEFEVTSESEEFCNDILNFMIHEFHITETEAKTRINKRWKGVDFLKDDDIRYHEEDEFWAYDIYYGSDSQWWNKPEGLTPLPLKP